MHSSLMPLGCGVGGLVTPHPWQQRSVAVRFRPPGASRRGQLGRDGDADAMRYTAEPFWGRPSGRHVIHHEDYGPDERHPARGSGPPSHTVLFTQVLADRVAGIGKTPVTRASRTNGLLIATSRAALRGKRVVNLSGRAAAPLVKPRSAGSYPAVPKCRGAHPAPLKGLTIHPAMDEFLSDSSETNPVFHCEEIAELFPYASGYSGRGGPLTALVATPLCSAWTRWKPLTGACARPAWVGGSGRMCRATAPGGRTRLGSGTT